MGGGLCTAHFSESPDLGPHLPASYLALIPSPPHSRQDNVAMLWRTALRRDLPVRIIISIRYRIHNPMYAGNGSMANVVSLI